MCLVAKLQRHAGIITNHKGDDIRFTEIDHAIFGTQTDDVTLIEIE